MFNWPRMGIALQKIDMVSNVSLANAQIRAAVGRQLNKNRAVLQEKQPHSSGPGALLTSDNLYVTAFKSSLVAFSHIIKQIYKAVYCYSRINNLYIIGCLSFFYLYIWHSPSTSHTVIKTLFYWSRECTQCGRYKFISWMLNTVPVPFFYCKAHKWALIGGVDAWRATWHLYQSV